MAEKVYGPSVPRFWASPKDDERKRRSHPAAHLVGIQQTMRSVFLVKEGTKAMIMERADGAERP